MKKMAATLMAGSLMVLAMTVPAFAQDPYGGGKPDDVKGIIIEKNPSTGGNGSSNEPDVVGDQTVVRDKTVVRGSSEVPGPSVLPSTETGVLPFTGGDVLIFLAIGGAAVIIGSTLVRRTREQ